MKYIKYLILLLLTSCIFLPDKVDFEDEGLKPLFEAMDQVDRYSLGFTRIDSTSTIRLEDNDLFEKPYDIMLHIYGKSNRTIAFEKIDNEYYWIGEQEIHTGPKKYESPDGIFNETLTLTFELKPISGHKIKELHIEYDGPDSKWKNRMIDVNEAKLIIDQWNSL